MIRNNRRVAALALGGVLTIAPAVTGCGAGLNPEIARRSEPPQGINFQVPGDSTKPALIEVRQLFVLGPADNQALNPGAAAPLYGDLIDSNPNGQPDKLVSVTSPAFSGPTEITGGAVDLPTNKLVSLNTGTAPLVVLKGLGQRLFGGENLSLTLNFANAGSVTVLVPVVPWRGYFTTYPVAPSAVPTTSASATPGVSGSATPAAKKNAKKSASPSGQPSASPSATP